MPESTQISLAELGVVPEIMFWDLVDGFPSPDEINEIGPRAITSVARFMEEFPGTTWSKDWIILFAENLLHDDQEVRHHCAKAIRSHIKATQLDIVPHFDESIILKPQNVNIEVLQAFEDIPYHGPVVENFRTLFHSPTHKQFEEFIDRHSDYFIDALELIMRNKPDWMTGEMFNTYLQNKTPEQPTSSWKWRAVEVDQLLLLPNSETFQNIHTRLKNEPNDLVRYRLSEALKLCITNDQVSPDEVMKTLGNDIQNTTHEVLHHLIRVVPAVAKTLESDQNQLLTFIDSLKKQILNQKDPSTSALFVKALAKSILSISPMETQLEHFEWIRHLVKEHPSIEVKSEAVKCLTRRSKHPAFNDTTLLSDIQEILAATEYPEEDGNCRVFLTNIVRDSMVLVNRNPDISQKYTIGNERAIKILGQDISIPGGVETVRISIGEVSYIEIDYEGEKVVVLMLNRSRLRKGRAEFGLIGGGVEFRDELAKNAFAKKFVIGPGQFEQNKPLDLRIEQIRIDRLDAIVGALLDEPNSPYVDSTNHLLIEFREEFGGEMTELSAISQEVFDVPPYPGQFPSSGDIYQWKQVVFPIQKSARSGGADSLRIQTVYNVSLPQELETFIRDNGTLFNWDQQINTPQIVNTPFLFIRKNDLPSIISQIESLQQESLTLPMCTFGTTSIPVALSGLLRALKDNK